MNRGSAIKTLAGIRLAVGAGAWITPRLSGKLFGLDAQANPQLPYMGRLFGVRDIALAWGALSTEGDALRQWLIAGIACDAADTLAAVAGGRGGYLPKPSSVLLCGTALSGLALGVAALKQE